MSDAVELRIPVDAALRRFIADAGSIRKAAKLLQLDARTLCRLLVGRPCHPSTKTHVAVRLLALATQPAEVR
jgi:hypothetical protein